MSTFIEMFKSKKDLNWQNLKNEADSDFISFFMLYHIGAIPNGTNIWLVQQAVEKYSKALLMKSDPKKYCEKGIRKLGHDLNGIWKEKENLINQTTNNSSYSSFIKNIAQIDTNIRYNSPSILFNTGFIDTFTILCTEFRHLLLENDKYHSSFYGLEMILPYEKYFMNKYSFPDFFKRLMHFYIEHGISFSLSGIPDPFSWTNKELIGSTRKLCQLGKNKEIEGICPVCQRKIWINGRRSIDDGKLLQEYLLFR